LRFKTGLRVQKIPHPREGPQKTRAPRKSAFDCQRQEIKDIEKCAAAMGTQRVNAVTEGIRLLKKELGLE
jgi:hypothetical protein